MPKGNSSSIDWAQHARKYLIQEEGATSRWMLNDNLGELRLFLKTMEGFIEMEEKREVEKLEPHANYPDFWADHYPYQWQQIIGSQLRQSFVVSLMSATEFHLGLFCRDTTALVQAAITHEDLKGGLIARARKHLRAFAQFTTPSDGLWETIEDFYVLRNNIVHNGALADAGKSEKRIAALINRSPGISIPSAGLLEIRREFCLYAIDSVQSFFDDLHDQQKLLCQRLAALGV